MRHINFYYRGWLSGRLTREAGAPSGTRMEWTTATTGRAHHSHPDWNWFSSNDQAWAIIDKCAEIGKKHGELLGLFIIQVMGGGWGIGSS